MVELGIRRLPETNEFKVTYREDKVYREEPSYYTDDREDAVRSLLSIKKSLEGQGRKVTVTKAATTLIWGQSLKEYNREGTESLLGTLYS